MPRVAASTALRPDIVTGALSWLRATRLRTATAATAVVGLAAVIAYYWAHWHVGPHMHQFDLHVYYRAIQYWADGHNIYDYSQYDPVNISLGFTYPPLAAVLMWPMSGMTFESLTTLTVVAILLATAACVALCVRDRFTMSPGRLLFVTALGTCAAFLLSPTRLTLSFGQINMFLALLVLADLLLLGGRGSRWLGIGIGLAMAIKLTPGVFLLYFVLGRNWRAVITAIGTAVTATLAAALVAPAETWQYFTTLIWQSDRLGFTGSTSNQSLYGLLSRVTSPDPPSGLIWVILVLAVGAVAGRRIRRALQAGDRLVAVTVTGMLGVLISPVSWPHHIVWVIPAFVVVSAVLIRAVGARAHAVAADPDIPRLAGLAPADRRAVLGSAIVLVNGLFALGFDQKESWRLPFVDYTGSSVLEVAASSLPMLWCLLVIVLLPIKASAGRPPTGLVTGPDPRAAGSSRFADGPG